MATETSTQELHYFAFAFAFETQTTRQTGSAYIGYPEHKVSVPRIAAAKAAANMPAESVLIGLGYMGLMTTEEAKTLGP